MHPWPIEVPALGMIHPDPRSRRPAPSLRPADSRSHAKFCDERGTPFKRLHENGQQAGSSADLQRGLSEALEQQAATSEILGVIAGSPTELAPANPASARPAVAGS